MHSAMSANREHQTRMNSFRYVFASSSVPFVSHSYFAASLSGEEAGREKIANNGTIHVSIFHFGLPMSGECRILLVRCAPNEEN